MARYIYQAVLFFSPGSSVGLRSRRAVTSSRNKKDTLVGGRKNPKRNNTTTNISWINTCPASAVKEKKKKKKPHRKTEALTELTLRREGEARDAAC